MEQLFNSLNSLRHQMAQELLHFVQNNGNAATEEEKFNLGLDYEDGEITKIYNIYENGGCFFFEPNMVNDTTLDDINEKNFLDKTYEGVVFTAYQCLYIVDGALKYSRYTNGGLCFDHDQAEMDDGLVSELPLLDLDYLISAIVNICESKRLFCKNML